MDQETSEKLKLEELAGYLDIAKEGFLTNRWEISQGALREFFNQTTEFIESSGLSAFNKGRLIALTDFTGYVRETLIRGVETDRWGLEKTVCFYHLNERIDTLKEVMNNYLTSWYSED